MTAIATISPNSISATASFASTVVTKIQGPTISFLGRSWEVLKSGISKAPVVAGITLSATAYLFTRFDGAEKTLKLGKNIFDAIKSFHFSSPRLNNFCKNVSNKLGTAVDMLSLLSPISNLHRMTTSLYKLSSKTLDTLKKVCAFAASSFKALGNATKHKILEPLLGNNAEEKIGKIAKYGKLFFGVGVNTLGAALSVAGLSRKEKIAENILGLASCSAALGTIFMAEHLKVDKENPIFQGFQITNNVAGISKILVAGRDAWLKTA
ncbi:MAG: hypothetical protein ACQEP8_03055 [Chlamydiota bacterium]